MLRAAGAQKFLSCRALNTTASVPALLVELLWRRCGAVSIRASLRRSIELGKCPRRISLRSVVRSKADPRQSGRCESTRRAECRRPSREFQRGSRRGFSICRRSAAGTQPHVEVRSSRSCVRLRVHSYRSLNPCSYPFPHPGAPGRLRLRYAVGGHSGSLTPPGFLLFSSVASSLPCHYNAIVGVEPLPCNSSATTGDRIEVGTGSTAQPRRSGRSASRLQRQPREDRGVEPTSEAFPRLEAQSV